ncbi:MAG: apolipoprotein N-acyltransferase [Thermus sp.]|uniref:apolipoprotein N-acyltransferase n=1 Tax=Thermus sp. TaxID=275 RepID=UPI0033348062
MWPLFPGLALALALPPFPFGPLAPLALIPLLRGGFRAGFLAGLGVWTLHLAWLPQSFGALFGPWGVVPFIPLILLKALSFGLLFALTPTPLARVGGWVVLEWLSGQGELAFPWGFLGYALLEAPGRVLAAWGGVHLLSLLVLLFAWALAQPRLRLLALSLWALLWLFPLPKAPADRVALLVQGKINPLEKALGARAEEVYLRLLREGLKAHPEAQVVVFPETALSALPPELSQALGGRPLVSGLNLFGPNRLILYAKGRILATYDKVKLVPFGERFPFREVLGGVYGFFFRAFGFGELLDRTPGERVLPLGPFGGMICYESAFPEVARRLALEGARVLVLATNDAWFGPSLGGLQHFALGRMRAVETGRWLLRAGNDGVTASIDPYGRVVARLPAHTEGYLAAPFAFRAGQTPYLLLGDLPTLGVALTLWLSGLRLRVRLPGWRNR